MKLKIWMAIFLLFSGLRASSNIILSPQQAPSGKVSLTVVLKGIPIHENTLRLIVVPYSVYGSIQKNVHTASDAVGVGGIYHFTVDDVAAISYFTVLIPYDTVSNTMLERVANAAFMEPGDSLVMTVHPQPAGKAGFFRYEVEFTGRGAAKNNCLEQAQQIGYQTSGGGLLFDSAYNIIPGNVQEKKTAAMLNVLDKYKPQLSAAAYDQLLVDFTYYHAEAFYKNFRYVLLRAKEEGKAAKAGAILDSLRSVPLVGSELARARSHYFGGAVIVQTLVEQIRQGRHPVAVATYQALKRLSPITRDRVLTQYLQIYNSAIPVFDSLLVDAKATITTPVFVEYIHRFGEVAVGSPAPAFELENTAGDTVRLSDFKNKVVFIDFWFTGCTACIEYYKNAIRPVQEHFRGKQDIVFISISVDRSKAAWLSSVASGKYTSADHVNLRTGNMGSNHPLITEYNIAGYPSPMLIDGTGRISKIRDLSLKRKDQLKADIERLLTDIHKRNLSFVPVGSPTGTRRAFVMSNYLCLWNFITRTRRLL